MTLRIGYIGLGALGRHLAGSLLRAGFPLTVYDVDSELRRRPRQRRAPPAPTRSRRRRARPTPIITCLPSPEAVASVVAEEGGVLEALAPGGTWIDMSTNDAARAAAPRGARPRERASRRSRRRSPAACTAPPPA